MNYQEIVKTVQDVCKGADISDYKKHLAVEVHYRRGRRRFLY